MLFEQTATIDYYFVCNWRGDVIRIYDGAGKINRKIEAGSERKEGVLCARHLKK